MILVYFLLARDMTCPVCENTGFLIADLCPLCDGNPEFFMDDKPSSNAAVDPVAIGYPRGVGAGGLGFLEAPRGVLREVTPPLEPPGSF